MAKKSRKELLKKEDAFLVAADQSAQWLQSNKKVVLFAVVLACALIGAVWGAAIHVEEQSRDGSKLLNEGLALLDAQVLDEDSTEAPDPEGDPPTFATEEDKWQAARLKFEKSVEVASMSDVGGLGRIYAADMQERVDELESAEAAFAALTRDLPARSNLWFLAVERLAYLKEKRGDLAGAVATFTQLQDDGLSFYDDYSLYHQARLHLQQGKTDKAREILTRVEQDFPDSGLKSNVKDLLALAGGPVLEQDSDATQPAEGDGAGNKEDQATP